MTAARLMARGSSYFNFFSAAGRARTRPERRPAAKDLQHGGHRLVDEPEIQVQCALTWGHRVRQHRPAQGRTCGPSGPSVDQHQVNGKTVLREPDPHHSSSDLTFLVPAAGRFEIHDTRDNQRLAVFLAEPPPEWNIVQCLGLKIQRLRVQDVERHFFPQVTSKQSRRFDICVDAIHWRRHKSGNEYAGEGWHVHQRPRRSHRRWYHRAATASGCHDDDCDDDAGNQTSRHCSHPFPTPKRHQLRPELGDLQTAPREWLRHLRSAAATTLVEGDGRYLQRKGAEESEGVELEGV